MARNLPWNPGHRPGPPKQKKMSNIIRLASAELERISVFIGKFRYTDADIARVTNMGLTPEMNEENILLTIKRDENFVSINLAALTTEELNIFEQSVQCALELARPVVLERDRVAREAYENGDGTYRRLHRGSPVFSVVTRKERRDDSSVQERSPNVLPGTAED